MENLHPNALWLLVPVKPFAESKSRLAPPLSAEMRASLSRTLLRRLLLAASDAGLFAGMIVVSRDSAVRDCAAAWGAQPLAEQVADLNAALEEARRAAILQGAEAVMVLPADLPLVTADALRALVALAPATPGMVIAPSGTGGTNALLLRPPNALPFAYGVESCARHCEMAAARGLGVVVHHAAALAFDVDLPDDLRRLEALQQDRG
jgi:2-phospho-L-lactate guanylyltransferase